MSRRSKNLNKIIRRIQKEKNLTRTNALYFLAAEYGLAYNTIHALVKHGRMPKRKASVDIINKLLEEKNAIHK